MAIIKMLQQVKVNTLEMNRNTEHLSKERYKEELNGNFRSKKNQKYTHTHTHILRPLGTFAVVKLVTYGFIIKPVQILGGKKNHYPLPQ